MRCQVARKGWCSTLTYRTHGKLVVLTVSEAHAGTEHAGRYIECAFVPRGAHNALENAYRCRDQEAHALLGLGIDSVGLEERHEPNEI